MKVNRKIRTGRVVSDKMDKTVVVSVEWREQHKLYRRVIKRKRQFKAHDETNDVRFGDLIKIIETRPLSKDKRWMVLEVVERADIAEVQLGEIDETRALIEQSEVAGEAT